MSTPSSIPQDRVLAALRDARLRIEALEAERRRQAPRFAIIGAAGRFPRADGLEAFWALLRDGRSGIRLLGDEELRAAGEAPDRFMRPDYVRAHAGIDMPDGFDAAFFGYAPREAQILDPQQRVFLETAWHALEDAAIDPQRAGRQRIGVFAGAALSRYLIELHGDAALRQADDPVQVVVGNVLGLMPTRVSWHLDLKGPSVGVQTGCSSSLVAVHAALRALAAGCEVALAGAVTIASLDARGRLHERGGIASPDGLCRAFDAAGSGTVFGSGVGVVVLKRLEAALADGDPVRAVLLGSAVNNDGAAKVGLLAPSVAGQAAVIRDALAAAGIDAAALDAVEAHGTGTPLGDPVEVAALHQALGDPRADGSRIALGSVKTNVGHLDAAAGMAGLLKMVLALQHEALPASLHFERANAQIDFAAGPLAVNTTLKPWPRTATRPRRAGISSFGMGGTNAHVVLEEAPPEAPRVASSRRWQLLPLSARSPQALQALAATLTARLGAADAPALADAALTLQAGRRALPLRLAVVARSAAEAVDLLSTPGEGPLRHAGTAPRERPVAFAFPGQGSQLPGMARALHAAEPAFRAAFDACADRLGARVPLAELLLADAADEALAARLRRTEFAQPALFVTGYALARLWQQRGVQPAALLGHSIGELTAACIAGVFSLDDALALVLARGATMQRCAPGAMLAVMAGEAALQPHVGGAVELAAVNGPKQCVLAGPADALRALQQTLEGEGIVCHALATSHAFHSAAMDAALDDFGAALRRVTLRAPQLPLLSNLSGGWMTAQQATDPAYWQQQLRRSVRFGDALALLRSADDPLLLELGPGTALAQLAQQQGLEAVPALAQPAQAERGDAQAAALLWCAGVALDWNALRDPQARRVWLPGYPFERQRYRIAPQAVAEVPAAPDGPGDEPAQWFWRAHWQPAPLATVRGEVKGWLLLADAALAGALAARTDGLCLDAASSPLQVRDALAARGFEPTQIVLQGAATELPAVLALLNAWPQTRAPLTLSLLSRGAQAVLPREQAQAEGAAAIGLLQVAAQEIAGLRTRCIDLEPGLALDDAAQADELARCLAADWSLQDRVLALRGATRWRQSARALPLPAAEPLKPGGRYAVVGDLVEGLGMVWARGLAQDRSVRLLLVGRAGLPTADAWEQWLATHGPTHPVSRLIRLLQGHRAAGIALHFESGPIDDAGWLARTLAGAGALDGVFHAGTMGEHAACPLAQTGPEELARLHGGRVRALQALHAALGTLPAAPGFVMLQGSLSAWVGGTGFGAYAAASAQLAAFAEAQAARGGRWQVMDWDACHAADDPVGAAAAAGGSRLMAAAFDADQAWQATLRMLAQPRFARVALSRRPLPARLAEAFDPAVPAARPAAGAAHGRPALATAYVAPRTPTEAFVAQAMGELLGIAEVGVEDDFFALGGHSLLAIQAVTRLRREYGVELPMRALLFDARTAAGLARLIDAQRAAGAPSPAAEDDAALAELLAEVEAMAPEEATGRP